MEKTICSVCLEVIENEEDNYPCENCGSDMCFSCNSHNDGECEDCK